MEVFMAERKSSAERIAASMRYNEENVVQFKMAFNKKTDADILNHLRKMDNKQGYIKSLIRKDMEN